MKIAVNARFLLPNKLEGIGVYKHELLKILTVKYPQHQFYFFFDRPYDPRFIYSNNVIPVVLSPPARHPFLFYIWFEIRVAQALKRVKPDVFLSLDTFTTLNTRVPRVTLFHDLAFEFYPQDITFLGLKYYRYYFPKFAAASAALMAVSEYTKQDIIKLYGIPATKIKVVYSNAAPHFRPITFARQVAIRQQYAQGEAYFIFVGVMQPRKNLVNIFKAFSLFKQKTGAEVKLLIVGRKGWKANPITKAYKQMQFKEEVLFTGRVSDEALVQLYGAAVATLFVSAFEGFGLPIVEAQNCGCPVITANTSAMPEIAGQAALLTNPFDVADIAEAMIRVYIDLDTRARLIKLGFENAKRFSWNVSAEKTMRILEEVGGKPEH